MEEQLVSFDTAKLAYRKGFDLDCRYAYYDSGQLDEARDKTGDPFFTHEEMLYALENSEQEHTLAPTQDLLERWLRKKKIIISVFPYMDELPDQDGNPPFQILYEWRVRQFGEEDELNNIDAGELVGQFESAREAALIQGLELLPDVTHEDHQ